jgi:hypothetical protein
MGKEKWVGKDRLVLARKTPVAQIRAGEMAQNCNWGFQI